MPTGAFNQEMQQQVYERPQQQQQDRRQQQQSDEGTRPCTSSGESSRAQPLEFGSPHVSRNVSWNNLSVQAPGAAAAAGGSGGGILGVSSPSGGSMDGTPRK
jgi:hypothetical protein